MAQTSNCKEKKEEAAFYHRQTLCCISWVFFFIDMYVFDLKSYNGGFHVNELSLFPVLPGLNLINENVAIPT